MSNTPPDRAALANLEQRLMAAVAARAGATRADAASADPAES